MPLLSHDQQISVEHVQNLKEYSLFLALDYFKKVRGGLPSSKYCYYNPALHYF